LIGSYAARSVRWRQSIASNKRERKAIIIREKISLSALESISMILASWINFYKGDSVG
jgi:hypothetical protein